MIISDKFHLSCHSNIEYESVDEEDHSTIELPSLIITENDIVLKLHGNELTSYTQVIKFAIITFFSEKYEY